MSLLLLFGGSGVKGYIEPTRLGPYGFTMGPYGEFGRAATNITGLLGAVVVTGQDAALNVKTEIAGTLGAVVVTGVDASFNLKTEIAGGLGAIVVTGQDGLIGPAGAGGGAATNWLLDLW